MKLFILIFVVVACAGAASVPRRRNPMFNPDLFEGDMIKVQQGDRNAVPLDSQRWPKGIVPYHLSSSSKDDWEVIKKAMDHISSRTCIKFVKRTTEKDYVRIFSGDGCFAHWGRIGGQQELSLGEGCDYVGIAIHEWLHAIGFEHEHNREDRDDYLKINWQNIDPNFYDAFEKLKPEEERLLTNFDYDSIMLYGEDAFAKEEGLISMESKDGRKLLGADQKGKLSKSDIERIQILYQC